MTRFRTTFRTFFVHFSYIEVQKKIIIVQRNVRNVRKMYETLYDNNIIKSIYNIKKYIFVHLYYGTYSHPVLCVFYACFSGCVWEACTKCTKQQIGESQIKNLGRTSSGLTPEAQAFAPERDIYPTPIP